MQADRQTYIRVGIFVTVALFIGMTLVFLIGNRTNVFQPKTDYEVVFQSVDGLRQGSSVRIAGVTVGTVTSVQFTEGGQVRAALRVVEDAAPLVREGSYASVSSKGMLGDKLVDISVGEGSPLPPGSVIPAEDAVGMGDFMQAAGRILSDVEATVSNLRNASEPLGEPEFAEGIRETSRNMAEMTRLATEGGGTVHRLLSDPELANSVGHLVDNLQSASGELAATSRSVRAVVREIESGDGTAHELIYGQDGTRMVRNFADAAGEVATMLGDIREGEGTMHDLIYEDAGNQLIANLTEASENIRVITQDVRQGKGTLGALIQDPSVYEDVKRLLGDLQRNEILRALVRYSIKRDETPRSVQAAPLE
jgi:phospholipid/cholesterol/gamma-HCH transport system substrate-binding protein